MLSGYGWLHSNGHMFAAAAQDKPAPRAELFAFGIREFGMSVAEPASRVLSLSSTVQNFFRDVRVLSNIHSDRMLASKRWK